MGVVHGIYFLWLLGDIWVRLWLVDECLAEGNGVDEEKRGAGKEIDEIAAKFIG